MSFAARPWPQPIMKPNTAFLAPLPLLLTFAGCLSDVEVFGKTNAELVAHVGEPCVLQEENDPTFSGTRLGETIIEEPDTCGTGVCLAWRFQGRASCPEGGEPGVLLACGQSIASTLELPSHERGQRGGAARVPGTLAKHQGQHGGKLLLGHLLRRGPDLGFGATRRRP